MAGPQQRLLTHATRLQLPARTRPHRRRCAGRSSRCVPGLVVPRTRTGSTTAPPAPAGGSPHSPEPATTRRLNGGVRRPRRFLSRSTSGTSTKERRRSRTKTTGSSSMRGGGHLPGKRQWHLPHTAPGAVQTSARSERGGVSGVGGAGLGGPGVRPCSVRGSPCARPVLPLCPPCALRAPAGTRCPHRYPGAVKYRRKHGGG